MPCAFIQFASAQGLSTPGFALSAWTTPSQPSGVASVFFGAAIAVRMRSR
jgi:hypothetical protein